MGFRLRAPFLQVSGVDGPGAVHTNLPWEAFGDPIALSIYDKNSVGPSIRPICTRCCFTMTDMIQVCSNFIQPEHLS